MNEDAREAIRRAIADHGPITFAEFMEHALYGPGGFYLEPPVGTEGHFVTSPHVHPVFAQLLGRALHEMWAALGRPDPFAIVELGAGDGTLARQILRELAGEDGLDQVQYTAIERSPGARDRLTELGVHVLPAIEAAPTGLAGCVIANELLDNLPFHWLRGTETGTKEVRVGSTGGSFVPVLRPWEAETVDQRDLAATPLDPGEEAAFSVAALRLVERIPRLLRSGYALFIDFTRPVAKGVPLVHGYRGHRVVEDVLADPGSADITAGVDLSPITIRAEAVGLRTFPAVSQRAALEALGYSEWVEAERHRQGELLEARAGRQAVEAWSGRNAAHVLVDPAALGRLMWLLISTPGLPVPQWLAQAREIDGVEGTSSL